MIEFDAISPKSCREGIHISVSYFLICGSPISPVDIRSTRYAIPSSCNTSSVFCCNSSCSVLAVSISFGAIITCSTFQNSCKRYKPFVSLPYDPASFLKQGENATNFFGKSFSSSTSFAKYAVTGTSAVPARYNSSLGIEYTSSLPHGNCPLPTNVNSRTRDGAISGVYPLATSLL